MLGRKNHLDKARNTSLRALEHFMAGKKLIAKTNDHLESGITAHNDRKEWLMSEVDKLHTDINRAKEHININRGILNKLEEI